MSKRTIACIGWLISLSLIVFAVFYFQWGEALNILRKVNPWFFLLLFIIYIFDFFLRAFRWKLLIYPVKKNPSILKLFYSYNIAYFANVFLPARMGELFRLFITGKEENISKRTILGTIFLERMFDLLGIGVLITFGIFIPKLKYDIDTSSALLYLSSVFVAVFVFAVLMLFILKNLNLRNKGSESFRKIVDFIDPLLLGFSSIEQFSLILSLAALSVFMWTLNSIILYLFMLSLSLGAGFLDSIVILLFQVLGEFIPSAPSSIGTLHASTVIGCKFVGLTADQGLVLGILIHFYGILMKVIFGLVSIQLLNFNFREHLRKFGTNG